MVCQIFKLWTWCFAFTVFEAKYMADNEFFRPWLNWLSSSPDSFDFERRLGVSYTFLGRMECLSFRNKDKTELSRAVSNISYDKLNCRVLRSDVLEMKSNILEVCCVLPERQGMLEAQNGLFSRRRRPR